jgi:hypothetical protein
MTIPLAKHALLIGALIGLSGCVHFAEVSYPHQTSQPRDMAIYPDKDKRGLKLQLMMSNAAALPSESFLIDGRGRRYSLHFESLEYFREEPLYARYHVTACGPIPSDSQFRFGDGSYTISLAYTNSVTAEHDVISRAFDIKWYSMLAPMPFEVSLMEGGH